VERGEKIVVGVNAFTGEHEPIPLLEVDESAARRQLDRLKKVRGSRSAAGVRETLGDLKRAAAGGENVLPFLLRAVKAYATLGEITEAFKEVYGEYREPATF
jgi:methylmalonyl-CoA mutase N-terminal domain/subunit